MGVPSFLPNRETNDDWLDPNEFPLWLAPNDDGGLTVCYFWVIFLSFKSVAKENILFEDWV